MAYRVPLHVLRRLGAAMLGMAQTSLSHDCEDYVRSARPSPLVEGEDNIPRQGSFCAIANHWERRGLWIGFPSSVLVTAVARRRRGEPPLHFAVVEETRLARGRVAVPGTAWAYRRVARCYGMVTVPPRPAQRAAQAAALRRLARHALMPPRGSGEPICFFPEGEGGTSAGMTEALPGSGAFLLLLSRAGVPMLPVGFAEVEGRLVARVGETFTISVEEGGPRREQDRAAATMAMRRVAALVPPPWRGPYGGAG
ncbi:MAG: hypothetical protein ABR564_03090 [Candidatus Dormibacteria bacterium]